MNNLDNYKLILKETLNRTSLRLKLQNKTEIIGSAKVSSTSNADDNTTVFIKTNGEKTNIKLGDIDAVEKNEANSSDDESE